MLLQVRDALEKQSFVSHGDVIEQDQMLVDLAHVADVWHYWQSELPRQQTDSEELRNPGNPGAIHLDEVDCARLHEVLEHDAVGNVLAERNRDGGDGLRELPMGVNIIRVSWFLYEIR